MLTHPRAIGPTAAIAAVLSVFFPVRFANAQSDPKPAPSFDVVSIRPNNSGLRSAMLNSAIANGFAAQNATLQLLVREAYRLTEVQIIGAPNWANSERYDITAKSDRTLLPDERRR